MFVFVLFDFCFYDGGGMTQAQMQLRIGVLVLTAILLFMGFVLAVGKRSALFEDRYTLWTSFESTEGLAVGAPVRLAGVTVGTVTQINFSRQLRERSIVLMLSVEQRVQDRIREDSVASIGTIGLVGDKVLDITVGSEDRPVLKAGTRIASENPIDYSALVRKGDRILDNVTRITASLDTFLGGKEAATGKQDLNESLRSLRTTLVQVEKGGGLLHNIIYGTEGNALLARLDRTAQSLERTAQAIETGHGFLHALIYTSQEDTMGRLTEALTQLDDLLRDVKEGRGLLHALIYDPQATMILTRLDHTGQELEDFVRAAREGKGLLPSLLFDPEGAKVLADLQAAAKDMRAMAADLETVTSRLRQGQGTIGGLLEDPTIYEDLSSLLRGANRSFLLRSLIRSTVKDGDQQEQKK